MRVFHGRGVCKLRGAEDAWIFTLTAVCILEVVAPPMRRGMLSPALFISLATKTISSRDGVMSPGGGGGRGVAVGMMMSW